MDGTVSPYMVVCLYGSDESRFFREGHQHWIRGRRQAARRRSAPASGFEIPELVVVVDFFLGQKHRIVIHGAVAGVRLPGEALIQRISREGAWWDHHVVARLLPLRFLLAEGGHGARDGRSDSPQAAALVRHGPITGPLGQGPHRVAEVLIH
eukprot:scaffold1785_cov247-Pinguiococcus_pyrenoidosus.AAC.7